MITVNQLIHAIELIQPVHNRSALGADDMGKAVTKVASLGDADADAIAFVSDAKYAKQVAQTQAGVLLISERFLADVSLPQTTVVLAVKDAYLAYASVSTLFDSSHQPVQPSIHPTAVIASSAKLGKDVKVDAYAVIADGVVIGDGSWVMSHAHIAHDTVIGTQVLIGTHVFIGHGVQIGDRVRIYAHASIGSDGFGFAPRLQDGVVAWQRIAQLGGVRIGNDSRIGAQTCIDRGAVEDTVIGKHVIIDNLVQIAHNVHIGDGTAIAAKTGIAGSTHIGKNCVIAGAVGINGHLNIADGVTFTGMSMVTKSISESGVYSSGTPAMPSANWRRAALKFRQMGEK